MGAVRKADFYFGSMLSCLINNGLAPAIIEPGDSRRIYKLSTDNGDYQLYAKYVSSPSRRQKKDAQLWQFIFSPDEVKYIRKPVVLDKTQTSIKIALAGGSPVE